MEIDTEVTDLLIENAQEDASLVWSKTLPVGVTYNCSNSSMRPKVGDNFKKNLSNCWKLSQRQSATKLNTFQY